MKFKILLFLCVLLLITTGCATILQDFEQDSLEEMADNDSVLYWNVNIQDTAIRADDLSAWFYISRHDAAKNKFVNMSTGSARAAVPEILLGREVGSMTKEGVTTIKGPVFKKAQSGKYRIEKMRLVWARTQQGWKYLDLYVDKEFSVPANTALYLGSFEVDVVKKENASRFSFNSKINQTENDAKTSFTLFSSKYPKIAAKYQNSVLPASYSPRQPRKYQKAYTEDNFVNNSKGWKISREQGSSDMYFENDVYIVESNNDEFAESRVGVKKLPYSMSLSSSEEGYDYDVELTSVWQAGREDTGFGLIIATGIQSYFFVVAKNGKAAVYRNYSLALPWKEVKALQDAKEYRQSVEVSPEAIRYFVNGEFVGRVDIMDAKYVDSAVGVVVGGRQKVGFKRLAIKQK